VRPERLPLISPLRYSLGVLVNALVDAMRARGHVHRELARRARDAARAPLVIVPPMLGVRLVDDRGRAIWGSSRRVYLGPGPGEVRDLRPDGVLEGFRIVPKLFRRDVFGGLLAYLERIYGARRGRDLFVLDYDWRQPHRRSARALAKLVAQVRGASDARVDLLGISSGGAVIRLFLAGGWADDPDDALADPVLGAAAQAVDRVVYLGAPLRGSYSAFSYLINGLVMTWGGYRNRAETLQTGIPAMWDMLPHDGDPLFADARGATLAHDHLDPATWRELGLSGHDRPGLADDLARVRRDHAVLRAAERRHPPSIVIADRASRTTTVRAVLDRGKLVLPCDEHDGDVERYPFAFGDGDGTIPAASMAAAPNQGPDGPWWIRTPAHRDIASQPHVHPLVVEALLAPHRRIPREKYAWPRRQA
jgi:hypothetical protein